MISFLINYEAVKNKQNTEVNIISLIIVVKRGKDSETISV